jgi:phosphohistidine phosphatase
MRTLHLLRHAKSDWADEKLPDRERPLAARGVKAARQLALRLKEKPIEVDLVLCSTARRTRETLELIRPALGKADIKLEDGLYGAAADELIARLRRVPKKVGAVLVIGHNPGIEEAAWLLLGPDRAPGHFPTCALAGIRFAVEDWRSIEEGGGEPIGFITPKDHDA